MTGAAAAQKWVPMPRWSRLLGEPQPVPETWRGHVVEPERPGPRSPVEAQVGAAVHHGVRRLPWQPSCLAQAAAAQAMLRRKGSPGVVVIGLKPTAGPGPWDAHAWLVVESGVLVGGAAANGFTPTTVFEAPGGPTAAQLASPDG